MKNKAEKLSFYQVLQALYYFVDRESKLNKSKEQEMEKIKHRIKRVAVDCANLALLNNWYNIQDIKNELPQLIIEKGDRGFDVTPGSL